MGVTVCHALLFVYKMLLAELFPYANLVYNILMVLYALSVLS